MTENELRKLTQAERDALPEAVKMGAVLYTLAEARELLALEGWEFVGLDDSLKYEPDFDVETDAPEVWRRVVGGRAEWCSLDHVGLWPGVPPERCYHRAMYACDPRTIEY
jgi:hypothetical protein